jgi:myosin heavy subunit
MCTVLTAKFKLQLHMLYEALLQTEAHYIRCIKVMYSLCTHYALTMHSLCTHYALTMHSLCTRYALTMHYIRCIKPNSLKKYRVFDSCLVLEQLLYSGIV